MKNESGFPVNLSHRFDTKIHTNQIGAYLPLLNNKAIELINKSQEKTDSLIPFYGGQYTNYYHFDNNKLSESTAKINEGYRGALAAFQSQPDEIFMYFGRITHALQDFYSHSNWYELSLGGLTGDQRLLDEGFGFFEELQPLKRIGETRVVALEEGFADPITAWGKASEWFVDPSTYVVSTMTDRGERVGGLMSGEVNGLLYGSGRSVKIVDPITRKIYPGFDHGGLARTISRSYLGPLAKDTVNDRYHADVLELARDQIQHELVRLISLIHRQFGGSGLRQFSDLFVRDGLQDEFEGLIRSRGFSIATLRRSENLNTLQDNNATDEVIGAFFKRGSPEVEVVLDDHPLPKEISRFADEISAGQFRWMASPNPAAASGDYLLEIFRNGDWFTTSFTSDEFLAFR